MADAARGIAARAHDGSGRLGVAGARLRLLGAQAQLLQRRLPRTRVAEDERGDTSKQRRAIVAPACVRGKGVEYPAPIRLSIELDI